MLVPLEFFSDISEYVYEPVPFVAPVIVAVWAEVLNTLVIVWLEKFNAFALHCACNSVEVSGL